MKQLLIIYAVAALVVTGGLFYMNTSIDSMKVESDTVAPVHAPSLTVTTDRLVGVESLQGGDNNTGYRLQPSVSGSMVSSNIIQ